TRRASVARAALDAGARIVNDVSALRDDEAMLPLLAARDADAVLMHRRGLPENTFAGPAYANVVEDVRAFLLERAAVCERGGVKRER
ncbi:dihydropteroate synthase, partial [Acinetobacter baumannii]